MKPCWSNRATGFVLGVALTTTLVPQVQGGSRAETPTEDDRQRRLTVELEKQGLVSTVARLSEHTVPVGTIVAHAGPTAPDGWLPCDGRLVHVKEYPELP